MSTKYQLVIESTRSDIPAVVRLRGVLKCLLRAYRFKVVEARETSPDALGATETRCNGKDDATVVQTTRRGRRKAKAIRKPVSRDSLSDANSAVLDGGDYGLPLPPGPSVPHLALRNLQQ